MSSLEERDVGVAAAPGSSSAGLGVGAVGAAVEAVAGVAAMQDEVGIRREGPESDTDEPPKKRLKIPEGESGKLEERLYSVLCCTVCLDLPKASVYQVNVVSPTPPNRKLNVKLQQICWASISEPIMCPNRPSPLSLCWIPYICNYFYLFYIQQASWTLHSYCILDNSTQNTHTHTHT